MRRLASSMIDCAVAVKRGGACGGLRRCSGAMLAVVSSLRRFVSGFENGDVGVVVVIVVVVVASREPRKWPRTEESLKAGDDESRSGGATMTMRSHTPTRTARVCRTGGREKQDG